MRLCERLKAYMHHTINEVFQFLDLFSIKILGKQRHGRIKFLFEVGYCVVDEGRDRVSCIQQILKRNPKDSPFTKWDNLTLKLTNKKKIITI